MRLIQKIKEEKANSFVENVIVLPIVLFVIFALIVTCFIVHDKCTIEGAAKRGAIYAAHCVSDPNYNGILETSGNVKGELDMSIDVSNADAVKNLNFSGIGSSIHPYRYIFNSDASTIEANTESLVQEIIKKTKFPWRDPHTDSVDCTIKSYVIYQDISVDVKGTIPIPQLFKVIGLEENFKYDISAKMTVNDPDEFIRNSDMVVDTIIDIDNKTGGHVQKAVDKFKDKVGGFVEKIKKWFNN